MFIGHYAVALALKKTEPRASLGVLFLAVQFADIIFFPLAIIGVERAIFTPGLTEASPLRLEFAPFTHGLVAVVITSGAAYLLFRFVPLVDEGVRNRVGLVVAAALFSHWVLDVVSHTPDMPLLDGGLPKLGFGLWNSAVATYTVEAALVLAGLWLYLRAAGGTSRFTAYGMIGLVVFMLAVNAFIVFAPVSPDRGIVQLGLSALFAYFFFAGVAFWLDTRRRPAVNRS